MGGKLHWCRGVGDLIEALDKDRAFRPQAIDDVAVVHDLMAHIDGRTMQGKRALDRVDRPHDPGAEAARRAEQHLQRRLLRTDRGHNPDRRGLAPPWAKTGDASVFGWCA